MDKEKHWGKDPIIGTAHTRAREKVHNQGGEKMDNNFIEATERNYPFYDEDLVSQIETICAKKSHARHFIGTVTHALAEIRGALGKIENAISSEAKEGNRISGIDNIEAAAQKVEQGLLALEIIFLKKEEDKTE